jgi:hypothetical protein
MPERRLGRPPKPESGRLTEIVCLRFRLTTAEVDQLYREARKSGQSMSAYLRRLIFEHVGQSGACAR